MEKKQINIKKYIGITFVFYIKRDNIINAVLKSLIVDTSLENFKETINIKSEQLSKIFGLNYIGINDVFVVGGGFKENTILGRISDYDNNNFKIIASQSIELSDKMFNNSNSYYKCVANYKCKDNFLNEFVIEIIILLYLNKLNFKEKIKFLNEKSFNKDIKNISFDNLVEIELIGIKEIDIIDLKDVDNLVFETLYADFKNLNELRKEVLTNNEIKLLLNDVFI